MGKSNNKIPFYQGFITIKDVAYLFVGLLDKRKNEGYNYIQSSSLY